MDGTRMGSRSSTRHGPASVFSGPVRRWKKTWAPVSSSNPSPVASRVLLYKWVPLSPGPKDETSEEPTTRPVRYLPVSIILARKKEAARRAAEEAEAAAQVRLAAQQSLNSTGNSTVQVLAPDSMGDADQKESDLNRSSVASVVDEEGQGKIVADSEEMTNKSEDSPIVHRKLDVEAGSTDVEMQDQNADENLSGGNAARESEGIEVLSDSSESEGVS